MLGRMVARASLRARVLLGICICSTLLIADHPANAGPPSEPATNSEHTEAAPDASPSAHAGSHGTSIFIDAHGLLLIERRAGLVIRADRDGQALAQLSMTPNLGQLVHDGNGLVFVADRSANRVVQLDPGDASGRGLAERGSIAVREPYGLALTPDSKLLLVTSVADHELLAFDTASLQLRWRVPMAPEPRPVAVSPDGLIAAVGFLSSGALAIVELSTPEPRVSWRSLDPRDHIDIDIEEHDGGKKYGRWRDVHVNEVESRSRFRVPVETGRRYVRNVTALAFVRDQLLVAHQLSTPQLEHMPDDSSRDTYGGGDREVHPVEHWISSVSNPGLLDAWVSARQISHRKTTAIVHDPVIERLYIVGYDDDVDFELDRYLFEATEGKCGIEGLAFEGDTIWVYCGSRRRLAKTSIYAREFTLLPELAPASGSELIERGAELFNRSDWRFSGSGLACADCHPEGRSDGLSWRLGPEILQTPILAGRVDGTAPYKWTGQDPTLHASFRHTIERLGGRPERIEAAEFDAIAAYLKSLPPPVTRSIRDPEAATRGRELFEDQGCDACHEGPQFTDGSQHRFETRLRRVDTPSLIGLGHSAPYYHDGSAQDLWALLTDKGSVHDMADTSGLSDEQLRDLIAYLQSL
jgi:mono/diheme cytochrome c family protein